MPKFMRHGPYKSKHSKECQILKMRILTQAGKLRQYSAILNKLKSELKGMQSVYCAFGKEKELEEIQAHEITIAATRKTHRHLVNLQIEDKKLYTVKYRECNDFHE